MADEPWRTDPDAALEEAQRRMAAFDGGRLDFDGLALDRIPDGLAALNRLSNLDFDNTPVADLGPLSGLSGLRTLRLDTTLVADLGPLSGLSRLEELYLSNTRVADLGPLAGFSMLQTLYLSNTQVADLGPLSGLSVLRTLYLHRTRVADIGPLAGLSGLQVLWLRNNQVADLTPLAGLSVLRALYLSSTQVADLGPLAGLSGLETLMLEDTQVADLLPLKAITRLKEVAESDKQGAGLSFFGTPAADRDDVHRRLAALEPRQCAIQTIEFLNGRHGGPPEPWRPPLVLDPELFASQSSDGLRWGAKGDALRMEAAGAPDPEAEEQLENLRRRAQALIGACQGDDPRSQEILAEAKAVAEIVAGPLEQVAPRIGALWGLTITLADYLREDEEAAESFSNIRLTPEQRGALRRYNGVAVIFVRLFPEGLRLDSSRAASVGEGVDRATFDRLVNVVMRFHAVLEADGELLRKLIELAARQGVPAEKARSAARGSAHNLILVLSRIGMFGLKGLGLGVLADIGAEISDQMGLDEKAIAIGKEAAQEMRDLIGSASADMQVAVEEFLEMLESGGE